MTNNITITDRFAPQDISDRGGNPCSPLNPHRKAAYETIFYKIKGGTQMKKMTILAVILAMAVTLTACTGEKAPEATETTAATTIATSPVETTLPPQPLTLNSWEMSASTWSSPNGATIHITATPNYHLEGQKADFVVRLESDDIVSIPCQWDGTAYTASADLNAANGYCYYVILTAADGTATELAVNTPAAPINTAFIDIEAALESYCNVTIEDSVCENGKLTLSSGQVQVKTPTITNDGEAITCQETALVLSFNGEELNREVLTLSETDTAGLLETALENITFDVPELKADEKVELALQVTLSNGQELFAYGGDWIYDAEGLLPVVG